MTQVSSDAGTLQAGSTGTSRVGPKTNDWLLEIGLAVLCELIEVLSERLGFRGFTVVDVYSDKRAIIETFWKPRTDMFELGVSDGLLRSVDEEQLTSLLVRSMAFAAIGCHETLARLNEEALAASQSGVSVFRILKLRRVLLKQREMRHALEFLADLKTAELGYEKGLVRFLETHREPLNRRLEYRLGWDIRVPDYKYRLRQLLEVIKVRSAMTDSESRPPATNN